MYLDWIKISEKKPKKNEYVFVLKYSKYPHLSTPETVDPDINIGRWIDDEYNQFLDANDQIINGIYWYPLPIQPELNKQEDLPQFLCEVCNWRLYCIMNGISMKLGGPICDKGPIKEKCLYLMNERAKMPCSEHYGSKHD